MTRTQLRLTIASIVVVIAVATLALRSTGSRGTLVFNGAGWKVMYNGYGHVGVRDGQFLLSPTPPVSPDNSVTHAALVTTTSSFGDLRLTAQLRTTRQLRPGTANPWEVAWLLWHLTDSQHFYAITLKPNGWELTKQVPGMPGGQQFLRTGASPQFPVNQWYELLVVQRGARVAVSVDGVPLVSFTDPAPYLSGSVGLYTEDAAVAFRRIHIAKGDE